MTYKTQKTLVLRKEIVDFLKQQKTKEQWIHQQIPKYTNQRNPVHYQDTEYYHPALRPDTWEKLWTLPGNNYSQKITNLFYDYKVREERQRKRYEIRNKLFPHLNKK